mgnify:CR=1 FL=1
MLKVIRQHLFYLLVLMASQAFFAEQSLSQVPPANVGHKTSVLLFISSETTADLIVPVAEIRKMALLDLHNHLLSSGHEVMPAESLDLIAGHWRIRNDWAISRPFLKQLEEESTTRLLVLHLRVSGTGLTLISRILDCSSGQLLAVEILDQDFLQIDDGSETPEVTAFFTTLTQLCQSLDLSNLMPNVGEPTLVLPAEGIGCDPFHALVTTVSVLQQVLKFNNVTVPDPALISTVLSAAQSDPNSFGPQGRRLLQQEFQSNDLLRLNIITYKNKIQSSALRIFDDDTSNDPNRVLSDFDLTLRRIRLQDGVITRSQSIFVPSAAKPEWFGLSNHFTALQRIDTAAIHLWQSFNNNQKDH